MSVTQFRMCAMKFDKGFAVYVCNQLPIGLLDDLAHLYYGHGITEKLSPDEVGLRKALEHYKSGDKLTD